MFAEYLKHDRLRRSLIPRTEVELFDTNLTEHKRAIDPEVRDTIVTLANEYRDATTWPFLTASDYMAYFETGRRDRYSDKLTKRRHMLLTLTLAEWLTASGDYLSTLIDYAWNVTEESTWILHAHNNQHLYKPRIDVLPDVHKRWYVDLRVAMTSYVLSMCLYFLGDRLDRVSPLFGERIRACIKERFILPFLQNDSFKWMGFYDKEHVNNWNTYIVMNALVVAGLLEEDDRIRFETIEKCVYCLDTYVTNLPADGGCDEGPGYWFGAAGSLYEAMKMLNRLTGGDFDFLGEPVFRKMSDYQCMMHITGNQYASFADGFRHCVNPGGLLYRMGADVGNDELVRVAFEHLDVTDIEQYLQSHTATGHKMVVDLVTRSEMIASRHRFDRNEDIQLVRAFDSLQVMSFREKVDKNGLFLCCKGGHNDESHNHNDIGNFVLYLDKSPVIIDAGADGYRIDSFGEARYKYWQNQSSYHNCPEFNGVMQAPGRKYRATDVEIEVTDNRAIMKMDLATAYPGDAGIRSCVRTFECVRRERDVTIRIEDSFSADRPMEAAFYYLLIRKPDLARPGSVFFFSEEGSAIKAIYDSDVSEAVLEKISLEEGLISNGFGDTLYRLSFRLRNAATNGTHVVRFSRTTA